MICFSACKCFGVVLCIIALVPFLTAVSVIQNLVCSRVNSAYHVTWSVGERSCYFVALFFVRAQRRAQSESTRVFPPPEKLKMPVCITCTEFMPYLYTIYSSEDNLRLEICVRYGCPSIVLMLSLFLFAARHDAGECSTPCNTVSYFQCVVAVTSALLKTAALSKFCGRIRGTRHAHCGSRSSPAESRSIPAPTL